MNFRDTLNCAVAKLHSDTTEVDASSQYGKLLEFAGRLVYIGDEDPTFLLSGVISPALQAVLHSIVSDSKNEGAVDTVAKLQHWFGLVQLEIPPEKLLLEHEKSVKRFEQFYAKLAITPASTFCRRRRLDLENYVRGYKFGMLKLESLYEILAKIYGPREVTDGLLTHVASNTKDLPSDSSAALSAFTVEVTTYLRKLGSATLLASDESKGQDSTKVDSFVGWMLCSNPVASRELLRLHELQKIVYNLDLEDACTTKWSEDLTRLKTEANNIKRFMVQLVKECNKEVYIAPEVETKKPVPQDDRGTKFDLNVRMVGNPTHVKPPMTEAVHSLLESQNREESAAKESLDKLKQTLESVVSKIANEDQPEASMRAETLVSLFAHTQTHDLIPAFDSEFLVSITGNILAGRVTTSDLSKLLVPFLDRWIEVLHDRING